MRYTQSRSHLSSPKRSGGGGKWKWVLIAVIFAIVLIWFIARPAEDTNDEPEPPPVEVEVEKTDGDSNPDSMGSFEESTVFYKDSQLEAGFIRRGFEDDVYIVVSVLDLPAVNPEVHFYELWLVKPGITDYFSLGALEGRADGKWAIIFEDDDGLYDFEPISGYSEVIVTRELQTGDDLPDPFHIAEASFTQQ